MPKTSSRLHLAIIPDGNRRWAKSQMLQPWKGHERAAENFRNILEWVKQDGRIGVVTIWAFSTENWKRDPEEVEHLMEIFRKTLERESDTLKENGIKLVRSGRTDRLSPELQLLIDDLENETASNTSYTLHLAIDYGGKDEVVRAIKSMKPGDEVTEESIRTHLDHPELPDIDLVIRTSGEQRTSNFALWQSAYAEWMFIDKAFPEFTGEDIGKAVDAFMKRGRRFGA